jgi:hypothetical protein
LVTACVPPRIKNKCTVAQALDGDAWLSDIQGVLSLIGFMEFLRLGDCLREVTLSQDEDQHIWRFDASGSYSAKSAYRAFSTDLSLLSRGGRYGSVGHLVNAIFSSGLPFKAATGRLIALLAEECHVWRSAPFVIKRKRRFSTSSLDVSSQDRYGLLFCCLWRSEEQHHATMNDHSHSGGLKLLARLRSAKKE